MTIEKEISKNPWPCHRFEARENSLQGCSCSGCCCCCCCWDAARNRRAKHPLSIQNTYNKSNKSTPTTTSTSTTMATTIRMATKTKVKSAKTKAKRTVAPPKCKPSAHQQPGERERGQDQRMRLTDESHEAGKPTWLCLSVWPCTWLGVGWVEGRIGNVATNAA